MVLIDPEFEVPTIPEDEKYQGTDVDANILKALPKGVVIQWATTYGASAWAISSKIDTVLPDGQKKSYFAKVYNTARVLDIARGEFESTKRLYDIVPDNVPRAVGYGMCAGNPNRSFFIAEFRDMKDELPGVRDLVEVVAKIHQTVSPTGKFGFPCTTFTGKQGVDNAWCDTWEEYFFRAMKNTMAAELETHGPDQELEDLSEKILTKVIPRLIRPMETEGRSIKPVLVHGDLWHGNVSVDNETKEPVLYDPCCFYAHHEYDFSMWRAARYRTNRHHLRAYYRNAKITQPSEDQDDRHALYALRNDLSTSICWPANKRMRQLAIEEMRALVQKYGGGYEEYMETKKLQEANQKETPLTKTPMMSQGLVCGTVSSSS